MLHKAPALSLALIALLGIAACDDDPVEPELPQDIEITVSPTSLTLAQGTTATIVVTLTSTGGYTGDVIVAAENSPDGVSIEGEVIEGGSGAAELDVIAAAGALLGTANIRIRALGSGVSEASTTLSLTVEP